MTSPLGRSGMTRPFSSRLMSASDTRDVESAQISRAKRRQLQAASGRRRRLSHQAETSKIKMNMPGGRRAALMHFLKKNILSSGILLQTNLIDQRLRDNFTPPTALQPDIQLMQQRRSCGIHQP